MVKRVASRLAASALARKSIEQVGAESASGELKKTLGAANLVYLGIGCILGAGIFVRTGNAAALHAGPAVIISFLIAGVICALSALCYAELSSTVPASGSAYTYCYVSLGQFAAWLMGALLLLEYGLAASVVAVGWSGYMVSLLHDIGIVIPPELTGPFGRTSRGVPTLFNLPAFLLCAALAALLIRGVSESAKANNVIVAIKLTVVVAFILICGLHVIDHYDVLRANWSPFMPPATGEKGEFGWSGVLRAASIAFFAYLGFEAVSTAGEEAKNPARDMPVGIIGALLACTILYILVSVVLTLMVPYTMLNVPDPVAVAVDALGPSWRWFAMTIKAGAIIGLTSVVLVLLYGQTRIIYNMSIDGLVPRVFGIVHARFRTPWLNTVIVGAVVATGSGFADINTLGDLTSIGTLCAFSIVCFTVIRLRRTHPDLPRGFRVPFFPALPLLGIASCLGLVATVEGRVMMFFGIYVVVAILVYVLIHARERVDTGAGCRQ